MSHAHSPWRVVLAHAIYPVDPAPLWQLLSDFGGLPSLVPDLITGGSLEGVGLGMRRILNIVDGSTVKEELIAFHPEQFRLTYAMRENEKEPWEHYFCTVQLQVLGAGQTHLLVTGYFQPRAGREALSGAYAAIFQGLERALGVSATVQPG